MSTRPVPRSGAGLTARLAGVVAATHTRRIQPALERMIRNGFIDTAAVMLAAREEAVTRIVRGWVESRSGGAAHARILFGETRVGARDAALVNGTAAHALDYDDVGLQGHPSAVLVPALLAEGERSHASGRQLIAAYVTGFEVWAELIARERGLHHLKGWHPTGIFGTVASAAAVAGLRGLSDEQAWHALGLAASMAAGLTANFGSMAKPFHAGRAAAAGIDAVDLAQAGMTAAPDVLEHPKGFLVAVSPEGQVDLDPPADSYGEELRLASIGLTIKKYPACYAAHRVIDAMLDLVHAHDVQPDQVDRVEVTVGPAQASMLRNRRPMNALEAKFSMQFAVAAALVARACGLAQLSDEFVVRPEVQALFELVEVHTVDTRHPTEPTLAKSDRVRIYLKDGRCLDSGEVFAARGDASCPLGDKELIRKFEDCTRTLPLAWRNRLLANLLALPDAPDVSRLVPGT